MPNQPLPASPYIDIFYTSNNRDKGEELKAPLSLYCPHFSQLLFKLLVSRLPDPRICSFSSSHPVYSSPVSILYPPESAFKLFESRLPVTLICFLSSSHPVYPLPESAILALRIPFTRHPHLLLSSSHPVYPLLASALLALRISFTRYPNLLF